MKEKEMQKNQVNVQVIGKCGETIKFKNKIMAEKTIGEKRVRTDFNVVVGNIDNTDVVAQIKQKTAELINLCETLKDKDARSASIAQTEYESAVHWAVKAATASESTRA